MAGSDWRVTASLCNLHRWLPQRDLRRLIFSERYTTRLDRTLVLIAHGMRALIQVRAARLYVIADATYQGLQAWPSWDDAAREGHVGLLTWMLESNVCRVKPVSGKRERGALDPFQVMELACEHGQLAVVLWVLECDPSTFRASHGSVSYAIGRYGFCEAVVPVLMLVGHRGCDYMWRSAVLDNMWRSAVLYGQLRFIQWAHTHGRFPLPGDNGTSALALLAASRGHMEVLQWLVEHGYQVDEDVFAFCDSYPDILAYLNGLGYGRNLKVTRA